MCWPIEKSLLYYRLLWLLAVLCSTVYLLLTVGEIFNQYLSRPKRTDIQHDNTDELPLPAVTLCNLSPYNQGRLNASSAFTAFMRKYSLVGDIEPPINFSDPYYAELKENGSMDWFLDVANRLPDVLHYCVFKDEPVDCNRLFVEHVTDMGMCFTFNSWEHAQKNNGSVTTTVTGSSAGLALYGNIQQDNYVFNENMAAGIKVSRIYVVEGLRFLKSFEFLH